MKNKTQKARKGKQQKSSSSVSASRKSLADYRFEIGSTKSSDYVDVKDYLINHIRKNFGYGDDIAQALEKLEPYDVEQQHLPTRQISTNPDNAQREIEQKSHDMIFKSRIDVFTQREAKCKENLTKACAFLWSQCSKGMQSKIKVRKNYNATTSEGNKIDGDPIELLKAIQEHSMSSQEDKYDMHQIFKAFDDFINIHQKDDEM